MSVKQETELYAPIKAFLEGRGYEVKAEIRNCDLVAYQPGQPEPVIVEMKKTFTLPLLLQGIDRQKLGAAVWLAIERNRTKKGAHNQRFQEIAALCSRLQLGLLIVTFYKTKAPVVEVWCEPAPISRAKGVRAARLQKEFDSRSGDYNVGGSTKTKLVTAYREKAVQCALALESCGISSPKQVLELTGCATAGSILRSNYYGWFTRVSKGRYALSPAGEFALEQYAELATYWRQQFSWTKQHNANANYGLVTK